MSLAASVQSALSGAGGGGGGGGSSDTVDQSKIELIERKEKELLSLTLDGTTLMSNKAFEVEGDFKCEKLECDYIVTTGASGNSTEIFDAFISSSKIEASRIGNRTPKQAKFTQVSIQSAGLFQSSSLSTDGDILISGSATTIRNMRSYGNFKYTGSYDSSFETANAFKLTSLTNDITLKGRSVIFDTTQDMQVNKLLINDLTDSNNINTGSIVIKGGTAIHKNLSIGGNIITTGKILLDNITDSIGPNSGALIIKGGATINKNLNIIKSLIVHDEAIFKNKISIHANLNLSSTVDSTDTSTGALVINGGFAVKKNVNLGNRLHVRYQENSNSLQTGAIISDGGLSVAKTIRVGQGIISEVNNGTPPIEVYSKTLVKNLNAELFNGLTSDVKSNYVGTNETQILYNKSIVQPNITLPLYQTNNQSLSNGEVKWNNISNRLVIGNGTTSIQFTSSNEITGNFVGLNNAQMLYNKTIIQPNLILSSSSYNPIINGSINWINNNINIGNGTNTIKFSNDNIDRGIHGLDNNSQFVGTNKSQIISNKTLNHPVITNNINFAHNNNYINFSNINGTMGYGIRDLNGILQFKNATSKWENIGGGGLWNQYEGNTNIFTPYSITIGSNIKNLDNDLNIYGKTFMQSNINNTNHDILKINNNLNQTLFNINNSGLSTIKELTTSKLSSFSGNISNTVLYNSSIDKCSGNMYNLNILDTHNALTIVGNTHIKKDLVVNGTVSILQNLIVSGNTTFINTDQLVVDDPLLIIGNNQPNNFDQNTAGLLTNYGKNNNQYYTGLIRDHQSKDYGLIKDIPKATNLNNLNTYTKSNQYLSNLNISNLHTYDSIETDNNITIKNNATIGYNILYKNEIYKTYYVSILNNKFVINNISAPILNLNKNTQYVFIIENIGTETFWITTHTTGGSNNASTNAYSQGITNNGSNNGYIYFSIHNKTPKQLYYQSNSTLNMGNVINITSDSTNIITDFDDDTYINVEKNTDEDIIRFVANNTETMQISNNNINISGNLNINGNINYINSTFKPVGINDIQILYNKTFEEPILHNISTLSLKNNINIGTHDLKTGTFSSTISTGIAPLTIQSTTKVNNLNADLLDGKHAPINGDIVGTSETQTLLNKTINNVTINGGHLKLMNNLTFANDVNIGNINLSAGILTSTVNNGIAPLSILSTTKVVNLNADLLDGKHAPISGQIVGTDDPQVITNKTLQLSTIKLESTTNSINTGQIHWDNTNKQINIGDSANIKKFSDNSITAGIHGITGHFVGTTDTQTIENKAIKKSTGEFTTITCNTISVLDPTNAVNGGTGALIVNGGAYIKKDVIIDSNLNVRGNMNIFGNVTQISTEQVVIDDPLLIIGLNQPKTFDNLYSGFLNRYGNNNKFNYSGLVRFPTIENKPFALLKNIDEINNLPNITNSNSTNNNSLNDLYINNLKTFGNTYIKHNVTIDSSIESNNTTSGSCVVKGGIGISKNVNIGGNLNVFGNITLNGIDIVPSPVIEINNAKIPIENPVNSVYSNNIGLKSNVVVSNAFNLIDQWLSKNLIDKPPAPTKNTPETNLTTTYIQLNWVKPQQIQLGFINQIVPKINNIIIEYKLTTEQTWANKITLNTSSANTTSLKIIADVGSNSLSGTQYIAYGIQILTNYDFRVYCTNENTIGTQEYLYFNNLATLPAGPPIGPTNLNSSSNTSTVIYTNWTKPTDHDTNSVGIQTEPLIESYKVTTNRMDAPNRYGGVLAPITTETLKSNGTLTTNASTNVNITNLKPGHKYNLSVSGKNRINTLYGINSNIIEVTMGYPSAPNYLQSSYCSSINNINSLISPYSSSGGYSLNGSSQISKILRQANISYVETITSSKIRTNYYEGTTALGISKFYAYGGLSSNYLSNNAEIIIDGFGTSKNGTYNSSNNITSLIISNDEDYYNGTTKNEGFYKSVIIKGKINSGLVASSNSYSLRLKQELGTNPIQQTLNTNLVTFNIDNLNNNPIVTHAQINSIQNVQYELICGVGSYKTQVSLNIQFIVQYLANYYLRQDKKHAEIIVKTNQGQGTNLSSTLIIDKGDMNGSSHSYYDINTSTYTTSTTKHNNGAILLENSNNNRLIQFNDFTISLNNIGSSVFDENIGIRIRAYNLYGSSAYVYGTTINPATGSSRGGIRIDNASITTKNLINNANSNNGLLVQSGKDNTNVFYPSGPGTGTNQFGGTYDHTKNLVTHYTTELQLVNGYFSTPVTTDGYKNYTSFYNVINDYTYPDYSSITSGNTYRFITFKYSNKINNTDLVTFNLINTSNFATVKPTDISLHIKINNSTNSSMNTAWLNANATVSGVGVTSNNKDINGTSCLITEGSGASTATQKKCYLPPASTGDLYIRLGIKLNSNKKIKYISVN